MAKMTTSAASTCSVPGNSSKSGRPSLKPRKFTSTQCTPVTRPFSPSTSLKVRDGKISIPSSAASRISHSWAGIWALLSRQVIPTQAAPRRTALMAVSMATLPPPRTRTCLPATRELDSPLPLGEGVGVRVSKLFPLRLTARKKSVAISTWSKESAPGIGNLIPRWAPTATKTASKPFSNRPGTSSTRWFRTNSTPSARMSATSFWTSS